MSLQAKKKSKREGGFVGSVRAEDTEIRAEDLEIYLSSFFSSLFDSHYGISYGIVNERKCLFLIYVCH